MTEVDVTVKNLSTYLLINLSTYKPIYFQKAAFTLAEVLITLGIIGVVAALTIPGLLTNIQHRDYTVKLKKFYSTMKQATMLAEEEFGPVNSWDNSLPMSTYVMTYLNPFLKFSIIDGTESTNNIKVVFSDGTNLQLFRGDCMDLIYDVNGYTYPNKQGYDQFRFLLCPETATNWCGDNGFCTYMPNDIRKQNSRQKFLQYCKNSAIYCSGLLEYDNWVFNKDYPYLK